MAQAILHTKRDPDVWLLIASVVGIAAGGVAYAAGAHDAADALWALTTVVGLVPLLVSVARDLANRESGVDVIALLAMGGALALGEYLAGAVIALMLSSGQTLEAYADARARRELSTLVGRAPRVVNRYAADELESVGIDAVEVGDRLLVKPGEVLPVDGVALGPAVLDESALTGESRPVERAGGDQVRSGAVNAGGGFDLRAIATAQESTYAGIVRLVEEAQRQKAPFVRIADRYALIFVPVTLVIAAAAWAISGDAVRALAVLVVATPCPLILAAPIAIVAGISRAARRGIIVKGGGALEALGRGQVLLFDKTGTLTAGMPEVSDIETFGDVGADELLRLAASLDQVSAHVLASAIVRAARERRLALVFPSEVREQLGAGIAGVVDGRKVSLGKGDWVLDGSRMPGTARDVRRRAMLQGSTNVFVSVDGELAGALLLDDPIRPDTPRVIRSLRREGFRRIVMITGDHADVAESVGVALGVDRILSERTPADKVDAVEAERQEGFTVMVGDGINDAPALAVADVGVAMGARGATASSEAADIVLAVDRLDRLAEAMRIARRSRRIALQSVIAGMALSLIAMLFAAAGLLVPVGGALIQELIDVAVILNALRALRGDRRGPMPSTSSDVGERFRVEHREFLPEMNRIRAVADRLDRMPPSEALAELELVRVFLLERLVRHEEEEEAEVYPVVAKLMGGEDPMATMSRAHLEISHLTRLFTQLLEDLPPGGPGPEDLPDLRRVLYGLHAILRLHFAQEEEAYSLLSDAVPAETASVP
ncbi:MAG: heavy metal translocating P-type ATPase [Actinomycetota bacterium]